MFCFVRVIQSTGPSYLELYVFCKFSMSTILCMEILQLIAPLSICIQIETRSHSDRCKSLHQRNSLRRTLYYLHNREIFPQSSQVTKDNFDSCPVIHSQITIVPLCETHGKVHNRSGTQHNILSFFIFFAVVEFRVLLNFIPYNSGKNSFFDCSILNYFKILSRYVLIEITYQAS